ncbi:MAG: signal recognition particle protein [Silvanigrellales bacterium]|nr:signal recognition particle protein [Silvanigrellales bacterium]
MFDILTQGFKDATLKLKGQTRLTEENVSPALEAVRRSLLDADVELGVVKAFLAKVRDEALGNVVKVKAKQAGMQVSAGDHFIQLCHDNLLELLGSEKVEITKNTKGPTVILLVGLQGAGKTTHAAKLAKLLKERKNMRPLLVAADVYRPAARDQLKTLAARIDVPFFTLEGNDAVEIARKGIEHARSEWLDLVIVDTAGRLAIDDTLMNELENIKAAIAPQNILLTIDAMIGQDAVRTASAFDARLGLTGVVLTKLDGDTRGGAALSVKKVTGKPILFVGTGESLEKLEDFRPEGMATRILGMGDIVGLMDDFTRVVDEEDAARKAGKMFEGNFDFEDFLEMTGSIRKMGSMKDIISKTPLMSQISSEDLEKVDDREIDRTAAIIHSMTKQERGNPDLLLPKTPQGRSRVARIAKGSGRQEKDVKDLVERFMQMRNMMNMMMGGMGGMGGGLGGLLGKIPGMGGLNQMANMAKMMKQAGGMGGMGGMMGMPGMADLMGGMGAGGMGGMPGMPRAGRMGLSSADLAEINRMKKRKKEEKARKQKKK